MSAFKDWLNGLTSKATPVDADETYLRDSEAAGASKKLTWANVKATLKTYFDTLYSTFNAATPGPIGGTTPNTIAATKVSIAAGTHTSASDRVADDSVTWNGPGLTMVAKDNNVTDTASAAGSILERWRVGGTTKVSFSKSGAIEFAGNLEFVPGLTGYGFKYGTGALANGPAGSGNTCWLLPVSNVKPIEVHASGGIAWSSSTIGSAIDFAILRNAAGVGEINNGTAGTYRDLKLRNLISSAGVIQLASYTAATLPSAATSGAGAQAYVTDSNATLAAGHGNTVAGGGTDKVPVTSDGTNWIIG